VGEIFNVLHHLIVEITILVLLTKECVELITRK
jgi:hypothetical protein